MSNHIDILIYSIQTHTKKEGICQILYCFRVECHSPVQASRYRLLYAPVPRGCKILVGSYKTEHRVGAEGWRNHSIALYPRQLY